MLVRIFLVPMGFTDSTPQQVVRYTLSFLPSRISAKLVADRMRMASVIVAVSATLCTYVSPPRSWFLRYATASALNVASTLQRIKAAEVAGNHLNVRVVEDEVLVRDVEMAMEKIGGRVNSLSCLHP